MIAAALLLSQFTVVKAEEIEATAAGSQSWSGIYVGVQAGGALVDTGWNFPVDSYFTLPDGIRTFGAEPDGAIVGGHLTWYRQFGSIVVGAELALNGGQLSATDYGKFTSLFPEDRFKTVIDNYGTLTARLGYVTGNNLIYLSGGYARGNVNFQAVSGPPGAGVVGEVDSNLNGATVGGGMEHVLSENVVIGLQYDYIWLDGATTSVATTGTPSADPFVLRIEDVEIHAVSARLSIKLGQM